MGAALGTLAKTLFTSVAGRAAKHAMKEVRTRAGRKKVPRPVDNGVKGLIRSKTAQGASVLAVLPVVYQQIDQAAAGLPPWVAAAVKVVVTLGAFAWTLYGRQTADRPVVEPRPKKS